MLEWLLVAFVEAAVPIEAGNFSSATDCTNAALSINSEIEIERALAVQELPFFQEDVLKAQAYNDIPNKIRLLVDDTDSPSNLTESNSIRLLGMATRLENEYQQGNQLLAAVELREICSFFLAFGLDYMNVTSDCSAALSEEKSKKYEISLLPKTTYRCVPKPKKAYGNQ